MNAIRAVRPIPLRRPFSSSKQVAVETDFDRKWRGLSELERERVRREWTPLNEEDWRGLTVDQKRASSASCTHSLLSVHD